jgi:hypothetical protein
VGRGEVTLTPPPPPPTLEAASPPSTSSSHNYGSITRRPGTGEQLTASTQWANQEVEKEE